MWSAHKICEFVDAQAGSVPKRFAAGKLETFRLAGMVEAMEKSRQAATISATVQ